MTSFSSKSINLYFENISVFSSIPIVVIKGVPEILRIFCLIFYQSSEKIQHCKFVFSTKECCNYRPHINSQQLD